MIELKVNGITESFEDEAGDLPFIELLHERLHLTGTKLGCGLGICQACTVAVRRHPNALLQSALSCSTPLSWLVGTEVITVEGVTAGQNGGLHPVQRAFLDEFAFQCGYCTPGFVMAGAILMEQARAQTMLPEYVQQAVENAIGGHVCRCTGYASYFRALEKLLAQKTGPAP
jgi:aerobic-type carbon monoxide dehydrogenase small subunit (CoxS/CutS family)